MVFCTGRFPETLTSRVPMIFPCDLLHKTVPLLTAASEIIAVTPSPMQRAEHGEVAGLCEKVHVDRGVAIRRVGCAA